MIGLKIINIIVISWSDLWILKYFKVFKIPKHKNPYEHNDKNLANIRLSIVPNVNLSKTPIIKEKKNVFAWFLKKKSIYFFSKVSKNFEPSEKVNSKLSGNIFIVNNWQIVKIIKINDQFLVFMNFFTVNSVFPTH